jgi:membrane protease YdiL (CAAX protease family)
LQRLLAQPAVERAERLSLYYSTIVFQWLAVGVAAWRGWAHGFTVAQLGLVVGNPIKIASVTLIGAALVGTLQWFNLRRIGQSGRLAGTPLQALAERILPQAAAETIPFFGLALTAGICEEFLYRGFAMAAFSRAGLPAWAALLASAVLFGLAHLYQGRGGSVSTMILGIIFGLARNGYDCVIPVMIWHVSIDAVAGVAGPKYLVSRKEISESSA